MLKVTALALFAAFLGAEAAPAQAMTLTSPDIKPGGKIADEHVANLFGCTGPTCRPRSLGPARPRGTKSFAISMYDPDAPTGSGFWHWWVVNIPADVTSLPEGAGSGTGLPGGRDARPKRLQHHRLWRTLPPPGKSRITTSSPFLRSTPTSSTSIRTLRPRLSASMPTRTHGEGHADRPLRPVTAWITKRDPRRAHAAYFI